VWRSLLSSLRLERQYALHQFSWLNHDYFTEAKGWIEIFSSLPLGRL
jgi:hypothetical protein